MDVRAFAHPVAPHVPAALMLLLAEPSGKYAKLACECFAGVYPRVFAYVCHERGASQLWQLVTALKQRIETLLDTGSQGAKIGAAKAVQRIVLVQTRAHTDPRVRFVTHQLANRAETNLASVPPNHPLLRVDDLEKEANALFTKLITLLFTASAPNTVMAVVSVLTRLARARPTLGKVVIEAYVSWTPAALAGAAHVNVRSVENSVRLAMIHFLHHGASEPHSSQLTRALEAQRRRMDAAARAYTGAARDSLVRKRDGARDAEGTVKRARSGTPADPRRAPTGPTAADIARLPVDRVVDAIIVGLQSVPEARLRAAIHAYVQSDQPTDPLAMDVGDGDLASTALPKEEDAGVAPLQSLEHFELPSPVPLDQREAHALILDSVTRICEQGGQLAKHGAERASEGHAALWIMLITRLATRGLDTSTHEGAPTAPPPALAEQAQKVRQLLCDFVARDFAGRRSIAQQWLAEEWTCDRARRKHGVPGAYYDEWLDRLLETQLRTHIDEAALQPFLQELPELPETVLDRLYAVCLEKATLTEGFALLREISAARPPLRNAVCDKVLQLTRHHERLIRGKAIVTARTWVLQKGPLAERVLAYAKNSLQLLKQAGVQEHDEAEEAQAEKEGAPAPAPDASAEGEPAVDAPIDAPPAAPPVNDEETDRDVLRLMELALVLSVKQPSIFREVVEIYPNVTPAVQTAMNKHVVPVARAVGPNNTALLDVLREAPRGADPLVHAVVRILIDKGHTRALGSLVLYLVEERELAIELLLPLLSTLEKDDIVRVLPRIIGVLRDASDERKAEISALFRTLVAPPPPATAGLTPVELMVLLHTHEDAIGLKAAVVATQVCFAMKDVFRSEVLTAVLNQLVDEPQIPVLFMRTAIMAIKSFRTLASYVSTSLLSRLVKKQIWTEPRLWDGFALCASLTAPTSFGALLQLPREQLRELVLIKQPTIREPLRDYLIYKAGGPARHAALLEMLDEKV